MDKTNLLESLQLIFRDVLDNNTIQLTEDTNAADIEEWDSLTNIQLVVAVEKHFKITFTTSEISSWKSIGDLLKSITAKKSQTI